MDAANTARPPFDTAGYGAFLGGLWSRGGAIAPPGGVGVLGNMSHSLGTLAAGDYPGMPSATAAQLGHGRPRQSSFEYGLGTASGQNPMALLQGMAGGASGFAPSLGVPGGLDVGSAAALDQQLQMYMHMTGTTGEPVAVGAAAAAGLAGGLLAGGAAARPPFAGLPSGFQEAVNASPGGLFSLPLSQGGNTMQQAGLGTGTGSSTGTVGSLLSGGLAASAGSVSGLFSPAAVDFGSAAAGGQGLFSGPSGFGIEAGLGGAQQQRQVLVMGLPPGLTDEDLRALFEVCGPLRSVSKQPEQVRQRHGGSSSSDWGRLVSWSGVRSLS